MPVFVGAHVTWFLSRPWIWTDGKGHVWHDRGAEAANEGENASGVPISRPGVALPNSYRTLGGWFHIEMPRIHISMVVQHIDIGPHRPVIDLSAPLAHIMFETPDRVIDYTPWSAEFIGAHLPETIAAAVTFTRTGLVVPIGALP